MTSPAPRREDMLAGTLLHVIRHQPEEPRPDLPRVVFCHGLFGRGRNWDHIGKALANQGIASIAQLDLPNHGESPWTDDFDYLRQADQVAGFIEREGPSILVGHSLGGKIAMLVALRHPHLIEKLVVVDIAPATSTETAGFAKYIEDLHSIDLTTLQSRREAEEQLAEREPNPVVRAFLLQNLRRDNGWHWQPNFDLLGRAMTTIASWPGFDGSPYGGPVLWMNGADSPYVQPEHEPEMRRLFPRTREVRVKGAGHWVHSQRPEVVINILRHFITRGTD